MGIIANLQYPEELWVKLTELVHESMATFCQDVGRLDF